MVRKKRNCVVNNGKMCVGDATLYLGDCLDVLKEIPDMSIELAVTDAPYFIDGMGTNWNHDKLKGRQHNKSSQTSSVGGLPSSMPFDREQAKGFHDIIHKVSCEVMRILKPGGFFVFFSSPRLSYAGSWAADEAGFEIRDMAIWEHEGGQGKSCSHRHWVEKSKELNLEQKNKIIGEMKGLGTPQLRPNQEPFTIAQKPCESIMWKNFRKYKTGYIQTHFDGKQQTNIFRFNKPRARKEFDHMTLKPVPLMERIIEVFSMRGQTVLDMFMGSGTTGEAAINKGRKFIGVEIDNHSFEVAKNRLDGVLSCGDH